ncbi:MAG: hypothetical protein H7296_01205 [Bacteroidia bacterium]|nr:hypothetical protein [Bacteroidia bacterium]
MKATNHTTQVRKTTENDENSNTYIFTPDILRSYKGCEGYTNVEANAIINSLEKLSAICYSMMHNNDSINIDNQQVVYLNPQPETKLKAA